jgi:L-cystine transport system permease protein
VRLGKVISSLLTGLPTTLILLVLSFVFASLIGIGLAWLCLRRSLVVRGLARGYLGIVRGTPTLLMLLVVYYGLPKLFLLAGIDINNWDKLFFAIAALAIGWSAYLAEAFRSAFLSVDTGQYEAALAVGMNTHQAFRRIIMPQTFLIAIPNIENLLIGLVKATSLVYVIGIVDMYSTATDLSNQNQGVYQLEIFVVLALIYWLIVLLIELGFRRFRKHYQYVTV